jgi:hypothetical protein
MEFLEKSEFKTTKNSAAAKKMYSAKSQAHKSLYLKCYPGEKFFPADINVFAHFY